MARKQLFTLSNPVAGRDKDYNDWYDGRHIGDLLKIPGIVAARRYTLSPGMGSGNWAYLAVYDLDTDDTDGVLKEIQTRMGTDRMPMSDALETSTIAVFFATANDK